MFKVNVWLVAVIFSLPTWEECGPCPVFACYTLAFALQLQEKRMEQTIARVVEKC